MGWNLLEPLVKVLLKKEEKNLHHCQAIFSHLLQVCEFTSDQPVGLTGL